MRSCCQQIALRYKEKSKAKIKANSNATGKGNSLPSSTRPAKHTRGLQPAVSMAVPAMLPRMSVTDLASLVHVPVVVGSECEADSLITVEALPI